jgi:hypothetical protein
MNISQDKNGIWITNPDKNISYPDVGNKDSFNLEDSSFWFKHRNNVIEKITKRIPYNGDFADIGGGNGYQLLNVVKFNKNNKNILIEPGYSGCLNARNRGLEHVYNMTFEKFDFDSVNITGVSLLDVVEHIEDDVLFLKSLYQKLSKGTKVYITLPTHNYLWSDVDGYGGHYRRYNKKMVKKLAKDSGFSMTYFSYFFAYLWPISLIIRAIPYKLGRRISDAKLLATENEQHEPKGIVKSIFNWFEKRELKSLVSGKIANGASCIVVFEKE